MFRATGTTNIVLKKSTRLNIYCPSFYGPALAGIPDGTILALLDYDRHTIVGPIHAHDYDRARFLGKCV
jgi:hypothetical protein